MSSYRIISLKLLIVLFYMLTCPSHEAQSLPCGLQGASVSSPFTNVSDQGTIEYNSVLGKIPLAENLELPFNIHFTTKDPSASLILGNHWFFGPIDSKIMKTSENNILMISPTGQFINFQNSGGIWHGGQWILDVSGDNATAQSSCGISLNYFQGRFTKLIKNNRLLLEVLRNTDSRQYEIATAGKKIVIIPKLNGFEVANLGNEKFEIHCDSPTKQ
jgi:hypothetical protein